MAEHPILFSTAMVQALLAGTKTQTRRVLKPQPEVNAAGLLGWHRAKVVVQGEPSTLALYQRMTVCDLLWVKETFAEEHPLAVQEGRYSKEGRAGIPGPPGVTYRVIYRTDGEPLQVWRNKDQSHPYFTLDGPADDVAAKHPTVCSNFTRDGKAIHWDNPRYMPREFSRIALTVTAVRVQRLQDISEADAHAEGAWHWREGNDPAGVMDTARDAFCHLWESIHGEGAWAKNPWVVAYSFAVTAAGRSRSPETGRAAA